MSSENNHSTQPLTESQVGTSNTPQSSGRAVIVSKENVVEVAKRRSVLDIVLWILALTALIVATLAGEYLPRYWVNANNPWVMVSITAALVVFALLCLYFTNQGRAFKTLLKDAGIELRRITWPDKSETTTYTWQVIVVTIIAGILIWLLDNLFNYVVGFILN